LLLRAPLVSLCHLQDHQETIASQRCWSHAPMAPPSERNHKKKGCWRDQFTTVRFGTFGKKGLENRNRSEIFRDSRPETFKGT
jgi:hypothetical protein